ncbi:DNA-J related domain-containing protein [Alteromonas sp. MTD1]|uniref:DNA-J related domain-containing protein n=1 Tax=Alteromonas sp. MTD1 TaxID=3057962 RepID=UPI0036F1B01D
MIKNKAEQALHLQFNEVLIDAIDTLQEELQEGISEYALISLLQAPPFNLFDERCLSDQSTLFKTHFILFHCLYRLQQHYLKANKGYLEIHALRIQLKVFNCKQEPTSDEYSRQNSVNVSEQDELAKYYLDWSNYKTTDKEIDALLASFWERFVKGGHDNLANASSEGINAARNQLAIPVDVTLSRSVLKQYYRKALQLAHPDKGGCKERAQAVIASYKLLVPHVTASD